MVDFLVIGSVLSVTYIESFDLVIQKRKMIGYNRVSDFIGGDKKVWKYMLDYEYER